LKGFNKFLDLLVHLR